MSGPTATIEAESNRMTMSYPSLSAMPPDVLASRIVNSLILAKGNLNEYGAIIESALKILRSERSLTFTQLRTANIARLPQFKNKHGELAHSKPDGSDWSPAQWLQAVVGELGEYANIRKKHERGDITAEEFAIEAAKELADVQVYLDILAFQVGVNLGEATRAKFNEVSDRVGCEVKL